MLSIIIPTYNEEKYLPKLLKSIKKQDIKDYEIIIADNNSKDKTRQIAKKFNCKIVKGGSRPGIGRNNGAKAAKGNLLLFLDADCYLENGFINGLLKEFKKKNLAVASCFLKPISNRSIDKVYFTIFNNFIKLVEKTSPTLGGCCILVRKDIHKKIKGFDKKIRILEEHDYVKKCLKHGKFGIIKETINTSVRRFDKFGRLKVGSMLLLANTYKLIFGPIKKDIFNYNFDYKRGK